MIQQKKRLMAFLTCMLLWGELYITSMASPISTSEVAEQKSVIDEPATMITAEAPLTLGISLEKELKEEHIELKNLETQEIYTNGWTNASVNVMREPSIDSEILVHYRYNTPMFKTQENDEWIKIKYEDGIYGYVQAEYVSDTENLPLNPYGNLIDCLTDEEKYLIYQVTYLESGNQTMEGQRACIEVILNRVLSDRYPNTVEGVLSQSGQFNVWSYRFKKQHNEQQEIALQLVYEEKPVLSQDYLMFSLGKFSWGRNYVKIDDVWFGTF